VKVALRSGEPALIATQPSAIAQQITLKNSKRLSAIKELKMAEKRDAAKLAERAWGITDLSADATRDISAALRGLLADVFALYLKTKNFHWHMSGAHFRDYHLLLDEQAAQLYAMTDPIAERTRKIGGITLRSIGQIARTQRIPDNDAEYVDPQDMLAELRDDNLRLTAEMRQVHNTCDEHRDVATASLLEVWIDETEQRTWFLYEASHRPPGSNG
jgi:starvation-inducible DNA-binding protein